MNTEEELKQEVSELRLLINDIIHTLKGRDDSVKEWIEERLAEIV